MPLQGWKEGSDLETLVWWSTENTHIEMFAMQIVQLKPDVILSNGTPATISFQHQTKDIPVVFTMVTDPVGQGLVKSLAQPGANLTGFTNFEFSMGGKWLGLLKEVSPKVAHVAVLYHPHTAPYAASLSRCKQAQRHRPFKFEPRLLDHHPQSQPHDATSNYRKPRKLRYDRS